MGYLNFKNETVEKVFRRFKWTRNNTLEILDIVKEKDALELELPIKNSDFEFKNILFQFQCIATTTDSYRRKIINHKNKNFGILISEGVVHKKEEIGEQKIAVLLKNQISDFEKLFKNQDEQNLIDLIKVIDHEHMHHGELILMLRANDIDLPKRFIKSWNL